MKRKMTMLMVLFLLSGCVYAAEVPDPKPVKKVVVPASVIAMPKIEVFPKEEEIPEKEEEIIPSKPSTTTVQTFSTSAASVSYSEAPKETAAVSYSEPAPAVQKESESAPKNDPPSPAPAPAPEPVKEEQGPACPTGVYPDLPCDAVIGDQGYSVTFATEEDANNYGYHMLNDVMYIGEQEITNFAVQPVYVNDHSRVAFYGVELYSNGSFLQ